MTRLVETAAGISAVTVRLTAQALEVRGSGPDADEICALVARWFDADADMATVHAVLGADPLLARCSRPARAARRRAPVRIRGRDHDRPRPAGLARRVPDVRWRLAAAYGREADAGDPGLSGCSHTGRPGGRVGGELQNAVGITGARTRTLLALAADCADGLTLGPTVAGDLAALADTRRGCSPCRGSGRGPSTTCRSRSWGP
ncbi:hypothetical protein NKG05_29450 [Oerskovia sp. M15]